MTQTQAAGIALTPNQGTSSYSTQPTSNRLSGIAQSPGNPSAPNTAGPPKGFIYDAQGNLANRLTSLVKAGITTTYSHDAFERRVRKFESAGGAGAASTVIFAYDQAGQLLGEYDSTGKVIREYVWLDSSANCQQRLNIDTVFEHAATQY